MAIRIITDSTCDISREDQVRMNIRVVPLTVNFPDASYVDGVDITNEQFFEKLDECKNLPTTSQVAPQAFVDAFQEGLNDGDEVLGIFLSGDISGTYSAACMARETLGSGKIHLVDSRNTTIALGLLVSEAVKKRDAGVSAPEIAELVNSLTPRVRLMAIMSTLKNLHKGGRLSLAQTVLGEAIGIKPLASIIDGKVAAIGKARGIPAAFKSVLHKVMDDLPDRRYGFAFAHACSPEIYERFINYLRGPLQLTEWLTCNIGSIVGTHIGKGAVGLAYVAKQRINGV